MGANSLGACAGYQAGTYQQCFIWIVDNGNRLIRQTNIETGYTTTLAGNYTAAASTMTDGFGLSVAFSYPSSIQPSSTGAFALIEDGCTVRQLVAHTAQVTTVVGNRAA